MDYSKIWHYDVESFPTFFCATFMDNDTKEVVQFAVGCGHNQLAELKYFITSNRKNLFVGFNNISYDDAVLRFVMNSLSEKSLPQAIFELSGQLVSDAFRRDQRVLALRYPRYGQDTLPKTMDLLKIMHFDRLGVSLKQVAINLKHERIQDLPYPYDYRIKTQQEVSVVMEYNINDVLITYKLYHRIQPQITLREEISELYGVDVMSASDSKMGNIILSHYYESELGINTRDLKDLRTKRQSVNLSECIPDVIQFQTPELQALRDEIAATTVYYPKFGFSRTISYRGVSYSLGIGGIHSMEEACKFEETEDTKIISCDIGSMYPACIIINNIYPEHLGEDFVKVLSMLTAERLAAKKTNKVKADGLKITVNGLFGKLNSDTFWLEDAKAMLRVTVAGQLYILMLVEMLELAGIHTISANTDGIECEVRRDMEETYYSICKTWEEKTGFQLEFIEYKKYIKRDVNNYVAVTTNGKVKTKGAFIPEIDLKKGYKHPIVPKAIVEYFVNGVPVADTIAACTDIMDFCISQKTGSNFKMELVTLSSAMTKPPKTKKEKKEFLREHGWIESGKDSWYDSKDEGRTEMSNSSFDDAFEMEWKKYDTNRRTLFTQKLQKNNRFYIARSGGKLQKNDGKKIIGLFVGQAVRLLNDYDPSTPFEEYDVNLDWYVREAEKLIEEIEPKSVQLDMFGGVMDFGAKTKMQVDTSTMTVRKPQPKKITDKEVREADRTRTTFNVSPKHFLVIGVDTTYSPVANLYSLAKGTSNKIKIPKTVFEKASISSGDVIIVDRFEKKPKVTKQGKNFVPTGEDEWWLTSYELTDNFEEFSRRENGR